MVRSDPKTDVAPPCAAISDPASAHGEMGLVDRELSWLDFNARVLQEAADPAVPLFERLGFLGIFSSNLDEFFRVRVASLRSLLRLKKKKVKRLSLDPDELLSAIHDVVTAHHEWFARLLQQEVLPALADRGIVMVDDRDLTGVPRESVARYFETEVRPHLEILDLVPGRPPPLLDNDSAYLAVQLLPQRILTLLAPASSDIALVRVPSPPLERFVVLPAEGAPTRVMFLDDVIRLHLSDCFRDRIVIGAWAVSVSRDAGLYLEDEFAGDVVAAIKKSLSKRKTADLTRFIYDPAIPVGVMSRLRKVLDLEPEDLVRGGRYHSLEDLRDFPHCGVKGETYPPWPPVPHPALSGASLMREVVDRSDQLLYFPYHSYDDAVRFLTEAAADPHVESIRLTIYRVSRNSPVLKALLEAAEHGKDVRVFVEARARFDEESNLQWAERLEAAGIVTHYSFRELKVHAKVALVVRNEGGSRKRYAYLGTGNFNEETARIYSDFALLTADPNLTAETERLFHFLEGREEDPHFGHLMVAPFGLRRGIDELMRAEIERARRGEPAEITFKVNGLEDERIIERLCEAAQAGVRVRGIVRGICRLLPDDEWGQNLEFRSIVDRHLEHARAYVFGNGGDPLVYLSSADWMYRNLNRRVEVAFPVRDPECKRDVLRVLGLQLSDNVKGRRLAAEEHNAYVDDGKPPIRSQEAIYGWLKSRSEG